MYTYIYLDMYMWHMYMNVDKYVYTRAKSYICIVSMVSFKECTVFALAKVTVVYIIPQFSDKLQFEKKSFILK